MRRSGAVCAVAALAWTACRTAGTAIEGPDVANRCARVGAMRVCWGPPSVVRWFPALAGTLPASPFACAAGLCTQAHPRQPDDGEWTCADDSGATVCVGGEPPAGVAASVADPRWWCGVRESGDGLGARVCVDFSPDFPDSSGRPCRWSYDRGLRRVCTAEARGHLLGDPCDPGNPCVDGALCVASRCVPPEPHPSCWLDADCATHRCRFGTCAGWAP